MNLGTQGHTRAESDYTELKRYSLNKRRLLNLTYAYLLLLFDFDKHYLGMSFPNVGPIFIQSLLNISYVLSILDSGLYFAR